MQRLRSLSIFWILIPAVLLSSCGAPAQEPVAERPTARPTAFTLPTASATVEPVTVVPSPTAAAPDTPAPVEPPVPTATPAAPEPAAPEPTAPPAPTEVIEPTEQPAAPTPTEAPPLPPTATAEPVPATPTAPAVSDHTITIDEPQPGTLLANPFVVRGSTNFWPFEASLGGVLKDGTGNVLVRFPVTVQSPDMGQGGPFSEQVSFPAPDSEQQGTLEIFEESPVDGSIVTFISILVQLGPAAVPDTTLDIEQPEEGASVIAPLHIALSGADGDESLALRLTQADGSVLVQEVQASQGYVVATMPGTIVPGMATLDIVRDDGSILGRRTLTILRQDQGQAVKVAWLKPGSEEIVMVERLVPRTPQIASAALSELLWGPAPGEPYATSLPDPAEVLAADARTPDWGPRVRLLKLTITDGVALADFGPELSAYGGGSARVGLIRGQIEATLKEFPAVREVVIAIDGRTEGVLEP